MPVVSDEYVKFTGDAYMFFGDPFTFPHLKRSWFGSLEYSISGDTKEPTAAPTPSPITPSPTMSPVKPTTPEPTSTGPQVAVFDVTLGAPRCSGAASSCDSGGLLISRGRMGPGEPNRSNTLDGCVDGKLVRFVYPGLTLTFLIGSWITLVQQAILDLTSAMSLWRLSQSGPVTLESLTTLTQFAWVQKPQSPQKVSKAISNDPIFNYNPSYSETCNVCLVFLLHCLVYAWGTSDYAGACSILLKCILALFLHDNSF